MHPLTFVYYLSHCVSAILSDFVFDSDRTSEATFQHIDWYQPSKRPGRAILDDGSFVHVIDHQINRLYQIYMLLIAAKADLTTGTSSIPCRKFID